jgi:hypothetical protein
MDFLGIISVPLGMMLGTSLSAFSIELNVALMPLPPATAAAAASAPLSPPPPALSTLASTLSGKSKTY